MKIQASILLAGSTLLVCGCGIRGDLERPPPLWGPDERTEEERAHETEGRTDSSAPDANDSEDDGQP